VETGPLVLSLSMAVDRPYYQTIRQFSDGEYKHSWHVQRALLQCGAYGERPDLYIRSFVLLQDDIRELFKFVEPADANQSSYSLRTLELLVRTCVELEANFKSIFRANTYRRATGNANLNAKDDYFKINRSHYLSGYRVRVPYWSGVEGERRPFEAWSAGDYQPLPWYQAYNNAKHDRLYALSEASLRHLIDAWCGLAVVLTAQFLQEDFGPGHQIITTGYGVSLLDGFEPAIGNYLSIAPPEDVPVEDRYEFDWRALLEQDEPFVRYDYDA